MGKLNSGNICVLIINNQDYLTIRKSEGNRYYPDDVYIYIMSKGKKFLVLEDSFEYSAYPEITNAIDIIINSEVGTIQHVIGAPCSKGGLQIWFFKNNTQDIQLKVVRSKHKADRYKAKYSANISFGTLNDWKIKLRELYDKKNEIFK